MEILTELANYLLQCDVWDPHNLNSPYSNKIKSLTQYLLDDNISLKHANEADILVPTDTELKANDFIENKLVVGLCEEPNWFRLASCVPLSLHIMARPIHKNKTIYRPYFMEFNKIWAEGQLE